MINKLEKQEILKGYHLVVMFVGSHRCGYLGLPKGHKLEGKEYDDIDVSVHGGLTFAEFSPSFQLTGFDYYIGFDCMHCDDASDIESMKRYGATPKEIERWEIFQGEVRTQEYVLNELHDLVEQLIKHEVSK